ATLPGCPDLVFPKYQTVVQVQGCFWHRHRGCRFAYTPSSNRGFWARKFSENVARDQRNGLQLRRLGWRVLTVWECELTDTRLHRLARSIRSGAR
ncbi:MAG TPA: hypothetical protein VG817_02355, partial [Gemmatimonadales bacterium]|nr:hypothetical protein [Gemmatimonadales bacterium]